jgi:cyclopropane fatty-acyl-phospholipid synthase-like methyltransferase
MSRSGASDRLVWAVEMLDVKPDERFLEIGCGQGVAVSLVCEKLESGSIRAIDQSEKMIAMAQKRNAEYVKAGKADFQTVALDKADFGGAKFDKIFAIRIGVFVHGQPARELEVIKNCLASGGSFYLIYDPAVAEQTKSLSEKMQNVLERHGFEVKEVRTKNFDQATVVCVVAGTV